MKEQKKRLSELKSSIKAMCADKQVAARMINELLSLQRQMDVEPTELHVPVSDVIATYDFGAFSLVRCRTCIIFKTTGYRLVAKPLYNQGEDGGALYSQLSALCDMKERFASVDKTEQELWSLVFNLCITVLSLPIDAFSNDRFLFDVATYIVKRKNELYRELLDRPLAPETEEDAIHNDAMEQAVRNAEEMKSAADSAGGDKEEADA